MGLRRNAVSREEYMNYCSHLKKIIHDAKRLYYERRFSLCIKNSKHTWVQINKILKPDKSREKFSLQCYGTACNDSTDVAKIFCKFFLQNLKLCVTVYLLCMYLLFKT